MKLGKFTELVKTYLKHIDLTNKAEEFGVDVYKICNYSEIINDLLFWEIYPRDENGIFYNWLYSLDLSNYEIEELVNEEFCSEIWKELENLHE